MKSDKNALLVWTTMLITAIVIALAIVITKFDDNYEKLAEEHNARCAAHSGRIFSQRQSGVWQIFCNDGHIYVIEEKKE